ncbi:MAG: hypothetical protein ISS61_11370 [Desulfobacteraceae bacterium]|nr:hypothetical protein [Desulfobacteraceae bacterium]
MESEQLIELMTQIKEKGIEPEKVEEGIKVPYQLLDLYTRSGPVPVTIINNLKSFLEKGDQ